VRLVAVSRVLNEEDVIEAMVRHHAALVDHHVILDNGSVDRTIEILAALRAEGVSVSVFQNLSVMFAEEQFNTQLYDVAVGAHAADWVLFLDADEFVDARRVVDLRALLAAVPPQFASLGVQMINYDGPTEATLHEINVAQKFVRRVAAPIGVWKVFVRASAGGQRITINAGNHSVNVDGVFEDPPRQDVFLLAHFPNRGPFHWAGKAVTGWLKVLAAGEMEANPGRSGHYQVTFDHLVKDPQAWISWALQTAGNGVPPASAGLVEDPIVYLGQPLIYTEKVDYAWRSLRLLLANTERLANAHGAVVEGTRVSLGEMRVVLGHADDAAPKATYGAVVSSAWRCVGDAGFDALLGDGWSHPEGWGGIWGVGDSHALHLSFAEMPKEGIWIEAFVQVPLIGIRTEQAVDVAVGDDILENWQFSQDNNGAVRRVFIPQTLISPVVCLRFRPRLVTVPAELDPESRDRRALGLGIVRVRCA
jgi:hypothetical protein